MAGEIASAFVRIRPNLSGFREETSLGVKSALSGAAKLVGATFLLGGAAEGIKKLAQSAAEHESAFSVLEKVVTNAGAKTRLFGTDIEGLLERESRLKGFNDEQLAQSFVRLVSVTKNTGKAYKDLGLVEDIARARHLDLAVAALAVSKAEQGSVTSLQRLGIVVPAVSKNVTALKVAHDRLTAAGVKQTEGQKEQYASSLKAAAAADLQARRTNALSLIQQRFGGSAKTFAESSAGQFSRLTATLHQVGVQVGAALLPPLTAGATGVAHFFEKLREGGGAGDTAKSVIGGIVSVLHELGAILAVVGPPLISVAHGLSSLASELGAAPIFAFVLGFKAIGTAVTLAAAARARYAAVLAAGSGTQTAASVSAKGEAVSQAQLTAALEGVTVAANAAAVAEGRLAAAQEAAALASRASAGAALLRTETSVATGRLTLGSSVANIGREGEQAAEGLGKTEAAASGLGKTAAGLSGKLSTLGTGLFALAGGWTTVAAVGAGALAFGLYKLSTRESELDKENKNLASSLDLLASGLQKARSYAKEYGDALSSIKSDRVAVNSAKLNVEVAKQALATTSARKGTIEYAQLINALAEAQDSYRLAVKQLTQDQAAADTARKKSAAETQRNEKRRATAIQDASNTAITTLQSENQAEQTRYGAAGARIGVYVSAEQKRQRAIELSKTAADRFATSLDKDARSTQAAAPGLARQERLLARFARTVGRVPSRKEVRLILGAPDFKSALAAIEKHFGTMDSEAKASGFKSGADWGEEFKRGVTGKGGLLGALVSSVQDVLKNAPKTGRAAAQSVVSATQEALKAAEAAVKETNVGLENAKSVVTASSAELKTANENLATTIRQAHDSVESAIASAKQNLASIGSSLTSTVGQFLDAVNKTDRASNLVPGSALFRRLRARIIAGDGGPETRRAAEELSQKINASQAAATTAVEKKKERVTRGVSDLVDEFNKGAISITQFNRGIAKLLEGAGINYRRAGKVLGIAFADGFRAQQQGLAKQAGAILAGPRRRTTGQEPSIVFPAQALKDANKQIASAMKDRDKALASYERDTKHLNTLEEQHGKAILHEASLQTKHLKAIQRLLEFNKKAEVRREARERADLRERRREAKTRHGGRQFAQAGQVAGRVAGVGATP